MIEPANETYFGKWAKRADELKENLAAVRRKVESKADQAPELVNSIPKNRASLESTEKSSKTKELPLADQLISVARNFIDVLFHDEFKSPFAKIKVGDHYEIHPMRSRDFRLWLGGIGYDGIGKVIRADVVKSVVEALSSEAVFKGQPYTLHTRVAWSEVEKAIYYDLCDKQWRAVKITADGWEIVNNPPILFRRYSHQAAQVKPVKGGSVRLLEPYLGTSDKNSWILQTVFIVATMVPDIPHPIPLLFGPQGSAKTSRVRFFGRLIDPSKTPTLSPPKDSKEAVQIFAHRWFVPLDNLQTVEDWLSDLICRSVTGEGFPKRSLFTDEDDIVFSFRRVIALNGIHPALTKPDALDRTFSIELQRIEPSKRRTEEEIEKELEPILPSALGAIFTALSGALRTYPSIHLKKLPRMADFAKWGCAIAKSLGFKQSAFIEAYQHNIGAQHQDVVYSNPVPATIVEFLKERDEWDGTATLLYSELESIAIKQKVDLKSKAWPKAPNSLVRRLKTYQHNLREIGILMDFGRSETRTISLSKTNENTDDIDNTDDDVMTMEQNGPQYSGDMSDISLNSADNTGIQAPSSNLVPDDTDGSGDNFLNAKDDIPF